MIRFRDVGAVYFITGSLTLPIPMLFARLLGLKTILVLDGSVYKSNKQGKLWFLAPALRGIEEGILLLTSFIVPEAKSIIPEFNLLRFHRKVLPPARQHIDLELFRVITSYEKRENVVGYIGRFEEEKGILNLVEAIPLITKHIKNVKFMLIGNGPLYDTILSKTKRFQNVQIIKWVPHEEIPKYLNQMKILVLPSYSEGVPKAVLEAFACNVLVLSTAVGGLRELVKDGETGFVIDDNSPEAIAKRVIALLRKPYCEIKEVLEKARALVVSKYSLEAMVQRHREILRRVVGNNTLSERDSNDRI